MTSINCKGTLLSLQDPLVMGIINTTTDSFYKGFLGSSNEALIGVAAKMIADGAAILDVGGCSTRPGSMAISIQEETDRVIPVIDLFSQTFPKTIISIDTFNSAVAKCAVEAGASIVNDIGGGTLDDQMITTVGSLNVPYICMHMKGTPATMQENPVYEDPVREILDFFIERIEVCSRAGINDLILDPGFGFGKTIPHNFQLLKNLELFKITNRPILAGLSRKSTIYKTLNIAVDDALNGTTVLNTMALMNGASILRVHDVKEAAEAIQLYKAYKKAP